MASDRYQTVKEAADLPRVGEPTVRRRVRPGELRAIDTGRGWRLSPIELGAGGDATASSDAGAGQTANGRHA